MDRGTIPVTWLTETWGYTTRPTWADATHQKGVAYQPVIRVGAGLVITEERYFTTEHAIREYIQQQLIISFLSGTR